MRTHFLVSQKSDVQEVDSLLDFLTDQEKVCVVVVIYSDVVADAIKSEEEFLAPESYLPHIFGEAS